MDRAKNILLQHELDKILGKLLGTAILSNIFRSARSIKLLNDVDLSNDGSNKEGEAMMIVAFGKAFTVAEEAPKKQIMNTLARAAIERDKALEDDEDAAEAAGAEERQGLLSECREGADSRLRNAATSPPMMRHADNG